MNSKGVQGSREIKVSVVIPVYNVAPYLRQCLDSVVNQTLRDVEIICVDDGSTDGSSAILAEYAAKDPRVKVISREHTNAGAARNAGMSVATGEYLGFVDSDDWCDLTLFEKAYAKAKAHDADTVIWRYMTYDMRTGRDGSQNAFPRAVRDMKGAFGAADLRSGVFTAFNQAPWNRIVRTSLIRGKSIAFQEIERSNDVVFGCLATVESERMAVIDEPLYHYRTGMASNLQANNHRTPRSVFEAWKRLGTELLKRGKDGSFAAGFATAASNSLFYTLNSIKSVEAYQELWRLLKELYLSEPPFSELKTGNVLNEQTRVAIEHLRRASTPLEYLVLQSSYRQEIFSRVFWEKEAALRRLENAERALEETKRNRNGAPDGM